MARRLPVLLDGEDWRRFFDAFAHEAWRFEAQPTYTMPKEQENVARFLRGEEKPAGHNARRQTAGRNWSSGTGRWQRSSPSWICRRWRRRTG
ncbi:hypothetical protein FNJ62_18620 [Streptomyces benahoarensis]|uniref:DUF6879 domain-containing protein n=1 Tax=Streptomyces benahoarensis TaxID=2595054 RepID=A0A553ZFQ2_9ACTN|nr:DUF6879 family protein [Streptomyces benahoarensis]TSB21447.1 hypothetical protein FNJ62_18620 [Streptomyces benahoarensis]TSB40294.1 hypothetical protein FNZ23_14105 [Streptomyces benahoarensis]